MRGFGKTCFVGTAVICTVWALWSHAVAQMPDAATNPAVEGEHAAVPEQPPIELVLSSDRETYAVGDLATFSARSSEDCYLTLINVDPDGRAVVLFPNEFEQDNRLEAARNFSLPMPDSPYKFRLTKLGREKLIGICTQSSRPVAGIRHDFERLRFTVLGDWDEFLDTGSASGLVERKGPQSNDAGKRSRAKARRQHEEPERPTLPDREARTEISYDVR